MTDGASAATEEILVSVQIDGGNELKWGVVEISITVNGGTPESY
ncbi:MAG: hypothetical protein ACKVJ7_01810 [Candidatus Poseidoniales archaeon]